MKKILVLLLVFTLGFSLTGCNNEQKGGNGDLIAGENAFEWGVNIKCSSSDAVKFFVEPTREDVRAKMEKDWVGEGMKSGTYGTTSLVPGKKKGAEAELDGFFTLYVNDKSGPSVTVSVQGTYSIDELPSYEHSYFFIYTDDGLNKVTKQEYTAFKTSKGS